jgi:hypothetical protein
MNPATRSSALVAILKSICVHQGALLYYSYRKMKHLVNLPARGSWRMGFFVSCPPPSIFLSDFGVLQDYPHLATDKN